MARHKRQVRKTFYSLLVLALLAPLLSGCAAYLLGGEKKASRGERHSYNREENRIRYLVNRELVNDPQIRATDIRVQVKDRVVYLYGRVASRRIIDKAIGHANSVSGVKRVVSRLRVRRR